MPREDMDLEDVLRETEAPSRASKKSNIVVRTAKLTGRTIASLKAKIKEKRLAKAYEKYNKNYREMRRALIEANSLRTAQEKGQGVLQSEVIQAFDIVEFYNKRLAKYAVRLLENDIKEAVQSRRARPVRVPRILIGKFKPIVKWYSKMADKNRNKKLQKDLVKDIKKGTRDYIETSITGALFDDPEGVKLRKEVDAAVIQGLALNREAEKFEDKIANLRKFISEDGKKPLFDDEKIGVKEKTSVDVPPVAPASSVGKEDKSLTSEDIANSLVKKPTPIEEEEISKSEEKPVVDEKKEVESKDPSVITVDALRKSLGVSNDESKGKPVENKEPETSSELTVDALKTVEALRRSLGAAEDESKDDIKKDDEVVEKTAIEVESKPELDKEKVSEVEEYAIRRNREINAIITLGKAMESLEKQMQSTSDDDTKKVFQSYIETLNLQLSDLINRSINNGVEITSTQKEDIITASTDTGIEGKDETVRESSIEPIEVTPEEDLGETTVVPAEVTNKPYMENVEVKRPESMRVQQASEPTTLRLTPQDIRKLEERNEAIQRQIRSLTKEKEELLDQKAMLERAIELDKASREGQMQVDQLTAETTTLKGEVTDLGVQAAPIISVLGKK